MRAAMPKATQATHSSKPYNASARPRKSCGLDKPIFTCRLDNCQWSSGDQSTVSRHKWTHLPRSMHPRCDALSQSGNRCDRRYFRLDSYKSHWNKCHKDQEWVIPQTRKRFKYLWQEFCELNDKRPIFITPSSFLQIAPGLDFPRGSSIGVAPPSALLAPDADTPTVPMRLAQAPAQMERVENSLDFFGQDLLASTTPLSATTVPILFHPPSAYNNTVTPIFFPSAFDHTYDSRYTPIGTPVGSRSSSVSTSSVPIPDVFISGEASHQLQSSLEPFGAFDPGFCPSQADDQDCGWKTFETYFPHRLDTQIDDYLSLLYSCSSLHSFGPT